MTERGAIDVYMRDIQHHRLQCASWPAPSRSPAVIHTLQLLAKPQVQVLGIYLFGNRRTTICLLIGFRPSRTRHQFAPGKHRSIQTVDGWRTGFSIFPRLGFETLQKSFFRVSFVSKLLSHQLLVLAESSPQITVQYPILCCRHETHSTLPFTATLFVLPVCS